MLEMLTRGFDDLVGRNSGPMHLRLILQPLMATVLAIRAGWADAWEGQPIFFWTLVEDPKRTAAMLRNLWRIAGKVFLVAVVLDVIYQIVVFRWVYPVETLIVATVLALVPCMVVRGVGNRVVTLVRLRRLRDEKRLAMQGQSSNNADTQAHSSSETGRESQSEKSKLATSTRGEL
jgi:hypothetical protein